MKSTTNYSVVDFLITLSIFTFNMANKKTKLLSWYYTVDRIRLPGQISSDAKGCDDNEPPLA